MQDFLQKFLCKHIGEMGKNYFCHSFRPALPSALASVEATANDKSVKRWGRWDSDVFEQYIRLSHSAKHDLFKKFTVALNAVNYGNK